MKIKNLMRTAVLGTAAGAMLLAQSPAPAMGAGPNFVFGQHMQARGKVFRELMSSYLGLSDQQKAQAKTIFQNARTSAKPILEQLRQTRTQLNAAVMAGQPTDQLAATEGQLMGKLVALRAGAREQLRALLTPPQQQKLQQLFANAGTNTAHRHGRSNG